MEKLLERLTDEDLAASPLTLILGVSVLLALFAAVDGLLKELITTILDEFSTSLQHWRNGEAPLNLPKRWVKTQNHIRAHFYVWGTIVERQDEEPKYFFNSRSLVMHRPLGKSKHNELMRDMQSVWRYQISFAEKAEYKGFLFSADQMYLLAKYIIGIAAFISGDPFTALTLHSKFRRRIE